MYQASEPEALALMQQLRDLNLDDLIRKASSGMGSLARMAARHHSACKDCQQLSLSPHSSSFLTFDVFLPGPRSGGLFNDARRRRRFESSSSPCTWACPGQVFRLWPATPSASASASASTGTGTGTGPKAFFKKERAGVYAAQGSCVQASLQAGLGQQCAIACRATSFETQQD